MSNTKKGTKVLSQIIYDTQLIFSWVMGLRAASRNVDLKMYFLLSCASLPTALFNDTGIMRVFSSKSDLKSKTCIGISSRNDPHTDCAIIDDCTVIWVVPLPASGIIKQHWSVTTFRHSKCN